MKSKNNVVIAVLVILIGISVFVAGLIFSYNKTAPEDGYFNPKKKATAQKIYEELTSVTEENYPQSPEEVVMVYLKGTRLLYGDMIEDEAVIPSILTAQRRFYAQNVLDENSLELQHEKIKQDIAKLKEQNICIIECSTLPIIFPDNDLSKGYVRVTFEEASGHKFYWKYFVVKDENNIWKIEGIRSTNDKFTE